MANALLFSLHHALLDAEQFSSLVPHEHNAAEFWMPEWVRKENGKHLDHFQGWIFYATFLSFLFCICDFGGHASQSRAVRWKRGTSLH